MHGLHRPKLLIFLTARHPISAGVCNANGRWLAAGGERCPQSMLPLRGRVRRVLRAETFSASHTLLTPGTATHAAILNAPNRRGGAGGSPLLKGRPPLRRRRKVACRRCPGRSRTLVGAQCIAMQPSKRVAGRVTTYAPHPMTHPSLEQCYCTCRGASTVSRRRARHCAGASRRLADVSR